MKDSGKMINAMEMDLIIMLMVQTIVDSGNKIYKTVMEFKNLIMVTFTKGKYLINIDNINMGKNMEKVNFSGLMVLFIKDSYFKIKYREQVNLFGQIKKFMRDIG